MWEKISSDQVDCELVVYSDRLRVPGGWIVRTTTSRYNGGSGVHQIFVVDPQHEWELEKK